MRLAPRPFFALCVLVFIAAAAFSAWRLLPDDNAGVMSCSTKGIMRFENMEKENVNGNIHFNFGAQGKGWHCCKVSDEAAFCLIQRPYISKTLLTRRISPRGSP